MTADELKAYCLDKGPAYSHPRFIDIVPALPLNGAGKVDRGIIQARPRRCLCERQGVTIMPGIA